VNFTRLILSIDLIYLSPLAVGSLQAPPPPPHPTPRAAGDLIKEAGGYPPLLSLSLYIYILGCSLYVPFYLSLLATCCVAAALLCWSWCCYTTDIYTTLLTVHKGHSSIAGRVSTGTCAEGLLAFILYSAVAGDGLLA
jgi:hypothetical protein